MIYIEQCLHSFFLDCFPYCIRKLFNALFYILSNQILFDTLNMVHSRIVPGWSSREWQLNAVLRLCYSGIFQVYFKTGREWFGPLEGKLNSMLSNKRRMTKLSCYIVIEFGSSLWHMRQIKPYCRDSVTGINIERSNWRTALKMLESTRDTTYNQLLLFADNRSLYEIC